MEVWKDLTNYEGLYKVSNLGRLKSLDRDIEVTGKYLGRVMRAKGVLLKGTLTAGGYLRSTVVNSGKRKSHLIHRLIALTFIPNPENKPYVNHINGIKSDNRVVNLEWVTHRENIKHAFDTGLNPRGENHSRSKLSEADVLNICTLLESGRLRHREIAIIYGVKEGAISSIKLGRTWNHLTGREETRTIFDMKDSNSPRARSIRNCRGEIFTTTKFAAISYSVKSCTVSNALRGRISTAGKYSDGTPVKWYYNETDNLGEAK